MDYEALIGQQYANVGQAAPGFAPGYGYGFGGTTIFGQAPGPQPQAQSFGGGNLAPPGPVWTGPQWVPQYADPAWAPQAQLGVQLNQQPLVGLAPANGGKFYTEWAGLPRTKICKCETVKIECDAQVLMKPICFIIGDDVNMDLLVEDIVIGKEHLINCDPVSAIVFGPQSLNSNFTTMLPTIQPGCTITWIVTNVGDHDLCLTINMLARFFVNQT